MSQRITLLFTKDEFPESNIPRGQLFFKEKGYTLFPLNIDGAEMEAITTTFKRFESFDDLIENRFSFSTNANKILSLIEHLGITTYLLEHYSDFAGIPDDFFIMIVKNGKIYPNSDYDSIEDILDYFLTIEETPDISRYKYYSTCEHLFRSR